MWEVFCQKECGGIAYGLIYRQHRFESFAFTRRLQGILWGSRCDVFAYFGPQSSCPLYPVEVQVLTYYLAAQGTHYLLGN